MTTIATDGLTIAADGKASAGTMVTSSKVNKVRVLNGVIYAVSGLEAYVQPLIDWHNAGADPAKYPLAKGDGNESCLLVIVEPGRGQYYTYGIPYRVDVEFPFALGSGRDFAIGAMEAGASPLEAVDIAVRRDVYSGGSIQVLDIAEATRQPATVCADRLHTVTMVRPNADASLDSGEVAA